jgi:hypothetical protein
MPFVASGSSISTKASYFPQGRVQRSLTPCTDEYVIAGGGLAFTITNMNSTPEDFYFGISVSVTQKSFAKGDYQGFVQGEAAQPAGLRKPGGICGAAQTIPGAGR